MTKSFTPGPWIVHSQWPCVVVPLNDKDKDIGGSADPDREARCFSKVIARERPDSSFVGYEKFHRSRVQPEEAEANARLISAAPELLSALRWSVNHEGECLGDHAEILEAAKALLAKAEGVAA